jgi:hypothetical protein
MTKEVKREMNNSIDLAFIRAIDIVEKIGVDYQAPYDSKRKLTCYDFKRLEASKIDQANHLANWSNWSQCNPFYTLEFYPDKRPMVKIKNHIAFYCLPADTDILNEMYKQCVKSWSKMKVEEQPKIETVKVQPIEKPVTFDVKSILTKIINTEDMKKDLTNVTLQIKQKEFDLIKAGTKKTDWRAPSQYNKKLLFVPDKDPAQKGKLNGNEALKTITFIVGMRPNKPTMIVEIAERIRMIKFSHDEDIPQDNFHALAGQFAIEIKLGKILEIKG